jgi:glucose/arabinose dehydrogenase
LRSGLRSILLGVGVVAVLVVAGGGLLCRFVFNCHLHGGSAPTPHPAGGIVDEVVAKAVEAGVTSFALLPDGRVLFGEKRGILLLAGSDSRRSKRLLDIRSRVEDDSLRGLLGVAVDPNFARNGYIYVDYVHRSSANKGPWSVRVSRFTVRGETALPSSERVILGGAANPSCAGQPVTADCIPVNGDHAGGDLEFAADGTLFVTTGDGGFGDAPEPGIALRSQALDSLAGKVLHVTRDGRGLPSNPWWNGDEDANRSKVWALGLRNPFRIGLAGTGNVVYAGDVGWNRWEELDALRSGGNYGWPCYEGFARLSVYSREAVCRSLYMRKAATPPVLARKHPEWISIIGGPPDGRSLLYGDFYNGDLRSVQVGSGGRAIAGSDHVLVSDAGTLVQIRTGPGRDIYYLSFVGGTLHRVHRTG